MSDLDELYQEVILDHNRNPRNQGRIEGAQSAEGYNPLCGDKLNVYVKLEGDKIDAVKFEGSGCAISQASASVMTTVLTGKTRAEAGALFAKFQRVVTGKGTAEDLTEIGELAAMAGVNRFPTRVKCATLGWHTLQAALDGPSEDHVSTE